MPVLDLHIGHNSFLPNSCKSVTKQLKYGWDIKIMDMKIRNLRCGYSMPDLTNYM